MEGKKDSFNTSDQRQCISVWKFNILVNSFKVFAPLIKLSGGNFWYLEVARQKQPWKYWISQRVQLGYFCFPWGYWKWDFWQCQFAHQQCNVYYPSQILGKRFLVYSVKDEQPCNCGTYSIFFPVWLHIIALILEQDSSLGEQQT